MSYKNDLEAVRGMLQRLQKSEIISEDSVTERAVKHPPQWEGDEQVHPESVTVSFEYDAFGFFIEFSFDSKGNITYLTAVE